MMIASMILSLVQIVILSILTGFFIYAAKNRGHKK